MKKKILKDKIHSSKGKKKKNEISFDNQVNPHSNTEVNQRILNDTRINLYERDKRVQGLDNEEDSLAVLSKQAFNVQSICKSYTSNNSIDPGKMIQSDYLNYHCIYCNLSFPNKMNLQDHCLTNEHQSVIISDEGRDWKFRPPPRGILANEYSLCQTYIEKGVCRFRDQCIQAHSKEEILEWKERFEYRSMKLEKAKERQLHGASYADKLLEKLNNTQNIEKFLSEKIDGVTVSVSSDVNLCISQKPSNHTWIITLHCPYQIHAIALLHDSHRNHFSLTSITMINSQKHLHKSYKLKDTQEWVNMEVESSDNVNMEYKIEIYFETKIYGTFRQALVVDFGTEPIFIQKFCVDIVPLDEFKELESARTTVITQSERWCQENTEIVWFHPVEKTADDLFNDKLLDMYPPPTNKNISLNQTSLEKHPTKNNYRSRMHDLLHYEEMAQFDLISHFNLKSYLHFTESYLIMPHSASVAKYALAGELYAKLDLSSEVSEDSPHGRLILNNCNSVFVTKTDCSDPKMPTKERVAYEALIEAKTKKEIYIRLSVQTVRDLSLQSQVEAPLEIQFQLNRLPFCEMHYGLDHLSTFEFLFPNTIPEPIVPWSPSIQWSETSDVKLNLKQKEALVAITSSVHLKLPPILVIGPFGTGKTYTLGQAINQVIQQPDTHVLICTHSNSAADIYIKDYLHPQYEAGLLETKPLRIYYHRRRTATVHPTIQKYCIFDNVNGGHSFAIPTKQQIMSHRIVVTTINSSISIAQLGIPKGYFTHIFIDEAAQVMECSTLIPLTLANTYTRIVLAGDYMQLSTEVFSMVSKERNLHMSLLERLYDLYPQDYPCKIMLVENYRSHPAIIKFTSTFFYEGRLRPRGKISAHPRYHPLTFFTAMGEDVQDTHSTAFYNNSEVLEVCERVMEICKTWPVKLWGPLDQESIGVVSPYLDQVMRIRAELRKKKLYKVSVERVLNVQGKEFRVVILSTVRTRHTCSGSDSSLDYGFLSNAKLLTTAITRAQSLVAVVGDPVSLCSLGKCRKLWEEFLRQCSEAGSLHGITWSNLRSQLDGIELRKIYGLNPLAQEFIPRYLLLSTVHHPMTLLPPGPPVQCFPYARPFPYSPNIFPTLPVSYPTNPTGFFPTSTAFGRPVQPTKPVEAHKGNSLGTYPTPTLPYQSFTNIYPNRAAFIPFNPAPSIAPFSTLTMPNIFPATNATQPFHPTLVQPPIGSYMATGALPYQPKVGVFPPVIPSRPPPGFNSTANSVTNNATDSDKTKNSVQQYMMPHNISNSVTQQPQELLCPSPDKSIQFLNNVHFPKEPSSSSNHWQETLNKPQSQVLSEDSETCSNSIISEEDNSQNHSDNFMGEQFVNEISKLLNEQSPIKSRPEYPPKSSFDYFNSKPLKTVKTLDYPENLLQNNVGGLQNNVGGLQNSVGGLQNSVGGTSQDLLRQNSSLSRGLTTMSCLTLQQVEKAMYSSPPSSSTNNSSVKYSDTFGNSSYNYSAKNPQLVDGFSGGNVSQRTAHNSQPKSLLTDSIKWSNLGNPTPQQFSLSGLFRPSGSVSSCSSVPLYLRKGTVNLSSNGDTQQRPESMGRSLSSSSGWDANTVNKSEDLRCSQNLSSQREELGLPSGYRIGGDLHYAPKPAQGDQNSSESKTYAGVLRSTLSGPDCEHIH